MQSDSQVTDGQLRLREVVAATGVSKELLHHYLREGLLPQPHRPGRYDLRTVGLVRLIRALREQHGLGLALIGRLFARFGHDPERLEALVSGDSLADRAARLTEGALFPDDACSQAELQLRVGLDAGVVETLCEAGLITPVTVQGQARFGRFDVATAAVCARGMRAGLPLAAFGALARHLRMALALEGGALWASATADPGAPLPTLEALFLRRELALAVLGNVLNAALQSGLRQAMESAGRAPEGLDGLYYRPSPAFAARFGLQPLAAQAIEGTSERSAGPEAWHHAGRVLLHAGRHQEAAFFLTRGLERWPHDGRLLGLRARAAVLLGEPASDTSGVAPHLHGPLEIALGAVHRWRRARLDRQPDALAAAASACAQDVARALSPGQYAPTPDRLLATLLCGWLQTDLPGDPMWASRGLETLANGFREASMLPEDGQLLPGERERLRLQSAFLLHEALTRTTGGQSWAHSSLPAPGWLADEIFRLDPGSAFAEAIYRSAGAPGRVPGGSPTGGAAPMTSGPFGGRTGGW